MSSRVPSQHVCQALLLSHDCEQGHHPPPFILFFRLFCSPGVGAQKVRVEEELEAYPNESVDLRCQFLDGGGKTKLTQVSLYLSARSGNRSLQTNFKTQEKL